MVSEPTRLAMASEWVSAWRVVPIAQPCPPAAAMTRAKSHQFGGKCAAVAGLG